VNSAGLSAVNSDKTPHFQLRQADTAKSDIMRLVNATTFKVHEFLSDERTPPFAILSHTWGDEECTFQQMEDPYVSRRKGFVKIRLCCEQALKDGLQWAWVDTQVVPRLIVEPS
jgi:hypothetical protein